jgi:hypothetical protein
MHVPLDWRAHNMRSTFPVESQLSTKQQYHASDKMRNHPATNLTDGACL